MEEIELSDLYSSYVKRHKTAVDNSQIKEKASRFLKTNDLKKDGLNHLAKAIGRNDKLLPPHIIIDIDRGGYRKPLLALNAIFLNHEIPKDDPNKSDLIKKFKSVNDDRLKFNSLKVDQKNRFINNLKDLTKSILNKVSETTFKKLRTNKEELLKTIEKRTKGSLISQGAKGATLTKLENTKDELDITNEKLDEVEEKLKELKKSKGDDKTKINPSSNKADNDKDDTIEEIKNNVNESISKLSDERALMTPEQIKKTEDNQKQITRLMTNKQLKTVALTGVGVGGGAGIALTAGALPYIPRIIKAIGGVTMKKKPTKEDIIFEKQTGIDRQQLEQDRRTIEALNRQIDNTNAMNRQKSINKYTLIGQQNRFNRVNIQNIRGNKIHVKNKIKMHNITNRKIFNI